MADLIQPRILRGFRDYLPERMIPREYLLEQARRVFRLFGFAPIDTPALEYTEILLGKGGEESDKLIYRFTDHGGRDVALRFDLTVPFARFAAQYINQLGTPFKRYHLGPVWRGENPAHGRFREFWQCDFDIIGTTANAADIEIALVIHDLVLALGIEKFRIHINNRLILNGLLEQLGLGGQVGPLLRALDKLPKIGAEAVAAEMAEKAGIGPDQAERVLALTQTQGTNREILDRVSNTYGQNPKAAEGVERLRELCEVVVAAGVPEDRIKLDLSIARGLDYYTGTIYETFLSALPGINSICSGGRYDNLAGLFTKQPLPGVGASLGLDRLLAAMEELNLLEKTGTVAPVLLVRFAADRLSDYERMARTLRKLEIGVEVYPEAKRVGQQLAYAEKRGFAVALISGPDEFAQGMWKVKDLARREETSVKEADVPGAIHAILSRSPNSEVRCQ
jgi:histidyl-tRNA synthetase